MFGFIFTTALLESLRAKRLVAWGVLLAVVGLIAFLVSSLTETQTAVQQYQGLADILLFRVVALVAAIGSAIVISQEIEERTIVYTITRPVPRWMFVTARTLAVGLATGVIGMIAAVVLGAISLRGFDFAGSPVPRDIGMALVAGMTYTTFFVFISLLLNRALIYCLLFVFGWEVFVPQMPGASVQLSIHSHLERVVNRSDDLPERLMNVPVWGSATVLAVIVIGGLLLNAFWFTRFEYVPREDAA